MPFVVGTSAVKQPSLLAGLLLCLSFVLGCFDATVPKTAVVSCRDGGDCPTGSFCLAGDAPRCVGADAPCVDLSGREAAAAPDGTRCGEGLICVASACVGSRCGDGLVTSPETCDGDGAGCRADCTRCGDGVLDFGESCDSGEQNNDVQPGACRTTCALASCGDGVRDPGEGCDDGAGNSDVLADSCRTSCVRAGCGDGVVDGGEVCDDGNTDSGDGCRADCGKVERCGDGIVDGGEVCDDGNDNPRDGCAGCRVQRWDARLEVAGSVEGRLAIDATLSPSGVTVDSLGRVYVSDTTTHRVLRVNRDGTITTIAGTGVSGFSGDDGPATSAVLGSPQGVAVDAAGRVFIADGSNNRVRRVDVDGTIATIAGTGVSGFSEDGTPAVRAALRSPVGVAVDEAGRVFIVDAGNGRIRCINLDGTITTVAGTGVAGFSGDGGPATSAALNFPRGVVVDPAGYVFVADSFNQRIRRIDLDGTITTIAGSGSVGAAGDGGPATNAGLFFPVGVAVDAVGRVIVAEAGGNRIRRVDIDGTITTIAGTGVAAFSGDGGSATAASLRSPSGVAADANGRVFVTDAGNSRLRRVDIDGTIQTIAGTGVSAFSGNGSPARVAALRGPRHVAIDAFERIFIADTENQSIRRVDLDGTIITIAGTGIPDFSGDGAAATSAALNAPSGVAVDDAGRVFIAETSNHRIRRVELDGTITTIAGTGNAGFSGEGGSATSAALNGPSGVAVDDVGRVFIADTFNQRIRRIGLDGTIVTIAGTGVADFAGDGGPATSAALRGPSGVAVDAAGRVFIADSANGRIRLVEVGGTITTVAGTGESAFRGDGVPATGAALNFPQAVAVDDAGGIVIADSGNNRVRRVDADGTITTIVGSGESGFSGDGDAATGAALDFPQAVAIDAAGGVVIADSRNNRVRRIDLDGTITTIAGPVEPQGPGPVGRAKLYAPAALALVGPGSVVSVGDFGRVLAVDDDAISVVVGYDAAAASAFGQARFAPLLRDARGVAFDPVALALVITEHASGDLRIIGLDADGDGAIDDAAAWTNASIATGLRGPAGIAYDDGNDSFVVADEADHCVQRLLRDGTQRPVFGQCGAPGLFPGFLNDPTHVVVSQATGAVYVADTGNHRVLRVQDGIASVVVGDGSVSSAGEGSPARLFPVNAPRQLAMDDFGNLYVASSTTVRLVANVDGDDDADGDDRVSTIFGGGARDTFPESDTFCLRAVAVDDVGDVYAADACQGYLVKLSPVVD